MSSKLRILFFTPFAGYTGSEIMLFNVLKHLNPDKFEVAVFSMRKGELLNTLPSHIKAYYYKKESGISNRISRALNLKPSVEKQVMQVHKAFKPQLWYLNTMVLNNVMHMAHEYNIKYAVHFHELLSQYNYVSGEELQKMVKDALFTVGCCDDVCNNLKVLGASKVYKQYECIETASVKVNNIKTEALKGELKIPANHKIITMSGQRTDRKGIDIFINVANELKDKPYFFLWLGAKQDSGYESYLEKFIEHNKLSKIRLIHPPRKDYYNYLNLTDIFFLSSKEDPFPLVMIEAAYLGKYIVSLNSGGVKEFLEEGMGRIIPSMNVQDIAKEIDACCQSVAANSNSKERAMEFDVTRQIGLFEDILLNECK